jgi:asparagine synthase (glutamine-hydrolysing)
MLDALIDVLPLSRQRYGWLKNRTAWKAQIIRDWANASTPGLFYENMHSCFQPREIAELLGPQPRLRELSDRYPGQLAEQLCLWDLHYYLPGEILAKVDRATMAVSIEGREPLLDHRVAEFAFRLPLAMRRGALGPKHILKKLLYNYVPREMVDRPKQGFSIPLLDWLKGDLHTLVDQYLDRDRIRQDGILDDAVVARIVRNFNRGQDTLVNKVWSLLAFQIWQEKWRS